MAKIKMLILSAVGLLVFSVPHLWAGEAPGVEQQKKAQLFVKGAQLWPSYCGNCHNPRGPSERSPADWDLIMMHMRSRANIPPEAAAAIVEFLKKR